MESTAQILKKVRELEIISKKNATHFFSGDYRSVFKGRGMNFREVRDYTAGDDVRFIDWNVSARYAHPFTKVFEEERELNIVLLVDISASSLMGTIDQKRQLIAEIGALISFSAVKNDDKIGAIFFSDQVERYIPPKKGRNHALYLVRELLTVMGKRNQTNISGALKFLQANQQQRSIVFILSDFFDNRYEKSLQATARKHDFIGLKINDPLEAQLPDAGLWHVYDNEAGGGQWLDTSNVMVRHQHQKQFAEHYQQCLSLFQKSGADLIQFYTGADYIKKLKQFFHLRLKKKN